LVLKEMNHRIYNLFTDERFATMTNQERAEATALILLDETRKLLEEATTIFGILARSAYEGSSSEKREELYKNSHRLIEGLINKMAELESDRVSIVLSTINCALVMINMIEQEIRTTENKKGN
jgi:hypothetical protein